MIIQNPVMDILLHIAQKEWKITLSVDNITVYELIIIGINFLMKKIYPTI